MFTHRDSGEVEKLIQRVRLMLFVGLTLDDIVEQIPEVNAGQVFLAYHAAKLLEADLAEGKSFLNQ
jgi:hypothetical protein